uniref:Uncharacterized protein n=1 Tax=Oryzias melastigma TaxID=30732 RepID=A0A3B3D4G0_ORYME
MKERYSLVSETPEMARVRANQRHISSVSYREEVGRGTAVAETPEMERVRRNQENISSVKYKQSPAKATSVGVTPEVERVKQNQENISSIILFYCYEWFDVALICNLYKFGKIYFYGE